MTNAARWDPLSDMRTALDRLYEEGFSRPWRLLGSDTEGIPVEISETDDSIEVKAQLPGVKPEDVSVTVANGVLTIKAEHREEKDERQKNIVRHEIRYGSLQRAVNLPSAVNAENTTATFANGTLGLKLKKSPETLPKRIPIAGTSGSSGSLPST